MSGLGSTQILPILGGGPDSANPWSGGPQILPVKIEKPPPPVICSEQSLSLS